MKKINLNTIFLLVIIFFSMVGIFYLTTVLTREENNKTKSRSVGQVKVKAESKTYTRTLALNNPSLIPTPTVKVSLSPTAIEESPSPSPSAVTPTPTEIILAYNDNKDNEEASSPSTVKPTSVTSIPDSGTIHPSIIIFSAALFLVLISLIY
ncbi:MAG: hypothetical protein ACPL1D_00465 [Microgenomates group bacterium]